MKRLSCLVLLIGFIFISVNAYSNIVEKEKQLTKSFIISNKNVRIAITNESGNVNIQTWDKSNFSIEVSIRVRKKDSKNAQEILDAIRVDIDDSTPGEVIKFITRLPDLTDLKPDEGVQVNYMVFMPKNNPLDINLKHGDLFLGSYDGVFNLKMNHGDINLQKLNGESFLQLSFVNGFIKKLNKGQLNVEYASKLLSIEHLVDVSIISQYSQLKVNRANRMEINSKHGLIDIDEVDILKGKALSTDFEVGQLHKNLNIYAEYVKDFRIFRISKGFKEIDLKGKFGSFDVGFQKGTIANLNAGFEFGDLKFTKEVVKVKHYQKKDNLITYRAVIGDFTGHAPEIKIQAIYGDVKLAYYEE